mmetsp:Transcript_28830/g.48412  ORF Transcript_28830/g.48412 Transcript_28830/m.48412 type:complete len:210 (-) Transcript_28830:1074-1703(-)
MIGAGRATRALVHFVAHCNGHEGFGDKGVRGDLERLEEGISRQTSQSWVDIHDYALRAVQYLLHRVNIHAHVLCVTQRYEQPRHKFGDLFVQFALGVEGQVSGETDDDRPGTCGCDVKYGIRYILPMLQPLCDGELLVLHALFLQLLVARLHAVLGLLLLHLVRRDRLAHDLVVLLPVVVGSHEGLARHRFESVLLGLQLLVDAHQMHR